MFESENVEEISEKCDGYNDKNKTEPMQRGEVAPRYGV
jgi:hypothetical protein